MVYRHHRHSNLVLPPRFLARNDVGAVMLLFVVEELEHRLAVCTPHALCGTPLCELVGRIPLALSKGERKVFDQRYRAKTVVLQGLALAVFEVVAKG